MDSGGGEQSSGLISDLIWARNMESWSSGLVSGHSKGKGKEFIPNSKPSHGNRRGLTFQELLHEVEVGNFTGEIISPITPYHDLNSAPESARVDNSIPSFAPITPGKSSSGSDENSNSNVDGSKEGSRATLLEGVGIVTPEPKPRRKRHRPRVITEKKPRTPKTPTTEIRVKRKYVRKKPIEKPSAEDEAPILEPRSPGKRSCKRVLQFGETELSEDYQSVSSITFELCRGIEEKESANGIDYGLVSWQNNKKKRSEKGSLDNNKKNNAEASSSLSNSRIVIDLTEYWTTTTTKKTSRKVTRAHGSSSFAPESYVDALIARKKRTRKRKPLEPPIYVAVEEIGRRLKRLDINRESENERKIVPFLTESERERNELVLFRDFGGAIVPVKKSLPRAKVELDEETTRVWKLLLENINSEGIDGMDEKKKKWWEEERSVFRGRAESFIARMHLVQGDRRFSKWKGSVLDSVVGVFLTQNVSDHLSSSAFMSLAARYPIKQKHESDEIHISENGIQIVTYNDPEDESNDTSEIADPDRKESLGSNDAECVNCSTSLLENLHFEDGPTETSSNAKSAETLSSLDHKERVKTGDSSPNPEIRRFKRREKDDRDWDQLRREAEAGGKKPRPDNTRNSLDWEAIRCAGVHEVADTIKERGMNHTLAQRIQDFLNRLVIEHGSTDIEWLRDIPPDQAKEYLLSIKGLGLKSVECVRLLTLHHLAFPVDTNVGRIAVRLGWVPLQPLPESLQLHLLELYPVLENVQKYLWPRLCKLDQKTLYELHYQMITFGKVFCTKSKPNCNSCPMRGECRHFASAFASARLALPRPEEKCTAITTTMTTTENEKKYANLSGTHEGAPLALLEPRVTESKPSCCEPIIEEPASPEPEFAVPDIEDFFPDDLNEDEIPTIKLDLHEFTQNVQSFMLEMSKALVSLGPEAASIPMPKLKNVGRLRTEHQVYELPDSHPLLEMMQMEKREPDDPSPYLLAIWTPGETPDSVTPPEKSCVSQALGKLCDNVECFSCNSTRETNSQIVRGTILIPCRTAMRGSFPLNGTYFQVNEVFADHNSSLNPINVQRGWIWKLQRRTVYFGTSIPTIFKGLTAQGIQQCFWKGYVCVRGFDQKTRAPRPLMARLHFPASKGKRTKDLKSDK